jgi:flagellin
MSLRIAHNLQAMGAHRQLTDAAEDTARSMEKLSSGLRINRGGDDAAGLSISERMRAQARGLSQAQRNIADGVGLVQTAEGTLGEVTSMLQRIRELAVQFKNGTIDDDNRVAIQSEVTALASEIARIGETAEFNGVKLLDNVTAIGLQVGSRDGEAINVMTLDLDATLPPGYAQLTAGVNTDLERLDRAIATVVQHRSMLGTTQNRLQHALESAGVYEENLVAAESRIRDVDMATEMIDYTKSSLLTQAGQTMLAQANQIPQQVLSLLKP